MSNPENIRRQLADLHYGMSRLQRKQILPKPLLDFICRPLVELYTLTNPNDLKSFLQTCSAAINAFRDALPADAFKTQELSFLTRTETLSLDYRQFAECFRGMVLGPEESMYPPYYQDFAEREPRFYETEPDDADERRRWRSNKKFFEDYEHNAWKEDKHEHEKGQKEFARELTPTEEAVLGTPLFQVASLLTDFAYPVPFAIRPELRFGHEFLVGASRSGKTTFLTAQLLEDLKRVERGECSVIVMDSQNEFVPNLSKLALFGKGQPLYGKLVYLEPGEYPIALNIFAGDFRSSYDNAEFFLNSIFKDTISSQQTTVLKYAIQALSSVPNATVATLMELMGDSGYEKFKQHFGSLDPVVHAWIQTRLFHPDFKVTRTAVRNRLDGFLADSLFRAMFADPKSKLDLFEELKTPKVILVNTVDLGGALEPFGRIFISLLDEAMLKRRNTSIRLPVFCYIDEASDYIADEPLVAKIIDKLGKQRLGMIISIQRKAQIVSATVLDALEHVPIQVWTIKPPVAHASVDHQEPVDVNVPLIELNKQLRMQAAEYEVMRADMRKRYGSDSKQPLPRAEKTASPKPVTPDDETDAKPW